MIGNNSCGATAQACGKTVDNVVALGSSPTGASGSGGATSDEDYARIVAGRRPRGRIYAALRELAQPLRGPDPAALPGDPAPGIGLQPGPAAARARLQRRAGCWSAPRRRCVNVLQRRAELSGPAERTLVVLGYPDIGQRR